MSNDRTGLQKIQHLLNTPELASLGPEQRVGREPFESLEQNLTGIFSDAKTLSSAQPLVRSLVYLWHDYLEESHSISQDIHSKDGSFLHGIMHRREPDCGNAKYWFRHVGEHPCYPVIGSKADELLSTTNARELKAKLIRNTNWDAFAFVDACEVARRKNDQQTIFILQRIQEIEFKTLLEHFLR